MCRIQFQEFKSQCPWGLSVRGSSSVYLHFSAPSLSVLTAGEVLPTPQTCHLFTASFLPSSSRRNCSDFKGSSHEIGHTQMMGASLVAQLVKNPPAMQETQVQFLGWEEPLAKGKATCSSVLAWRIPWTV